MGAFMEKVHTSRWMPEVTNIRQFPLPA